MRLGAWLLLRTGLFPSEIKALCSVRCGPTNEGEFPYGLSGSREGSDVCTLVSTGWPLFRELFEGKGPQLRDEFVLGPGCAHVQRQRVMGKREGHWDLPERVPQLIS